jgi:hypothetical protein
VDGRGKIVKEAKVASEPEALVYLFKELGFPVNRIGFEAGPLFCVLAGGGKDGPRRDEWSRNNQASLQDWPSALTFI